MGFVSPYYGFIILAGKTGHGSHAAEADHELSIILLCLTADAGGQGYAWDLQTECSQSGTQGSQHGSGGTTAMEEWEL